MLRKQILALANELSKNLQLPSKKEVNKLNNKFNRLERMLASIHQVHVDDYVGKLLSNEKYQDPKRLQKHGYKATSQFDEDGIIQEIFERVGATNKTFLEIGVGDGFENNTLYLLHQGWRGTWIDCRYGKEIQKNFTDVIESNRLKHINSFVTSENINDLVAQSGLKGEIDLLSIDIDGTDYYLWENLEVVNPRVVVIEYNVKFRPPMLWKIKYDPNHNSRKTDYFGASLKSYELLAKKKGYSLVGCTLTGANAFFVRNDLVNEETFCAPFTAENHYEPCRYPTAWGYRSGMNAGFGPNDELN